MVIKKIGLSPCFFYPDSSRTVFGPKSLTYMENQMAEFVARENIMPFLIPDVGQDLLKNYIAACDGIILQGGSDLSPTSYGETPIENGRWPGDPYRDQYEFKIIQLALEYGKPLFGICRGLQLINAYFGGTLWQDLATQTSSPLTHRDALKYDTIHHSVSLTPDSLLRTIYPGQNALEVNSIHHQGIKILAKDLVADGISEQDNIIEAFHHNKNKNIFAVQWHPEFSSTLEGVVADPRPLFEHFLSIINSIS